jgi:Tol biopolymer transport system component
MKLETKETSLGKIHPCRVEDTLTVSPDSKRVAYWANCIAESLGNKPTAFATEQIDYIRSVGGWSQVLGVWRLVVDGVEHGEYARILGHPPVFSPDSKRVAYGAVRGEKMFVVVDGQEGREYDGIGEGDPIFSPDNKRVAYVAKRQGKVLVVVDGIEGKEYAGIIKGTPIFSPDSTRVAFAATPVGRDCMVAVVDGEEGKEYDFILNQNLLFSPDSRRIAYMAARAPGE